MGVLDKLGLRKSSPPDFSRWLADRLKDMHAQGGSLEIAAEIGERVSKDFKDSGPAGLEIPIDAWVDCVPPSQIMELFMDRRWLDTSGAALEGPAREGLDRLVSCLDLLGISNATEFMRDPGWVMDQMEAAGGMVNTVWPIGSDEEALRARVAEATRLTLESVHWTLFDLRRWTLGFVLMLSFPEDLNMANRFHVLVMTVVRDRYLTEVKPPAEDPEWPLSLTMLYNEAIGLVEGGPDRLGLLGHHVGREFARRLGAPGYPGMRGVGTREFMTAFNNTLGYVNAIKRTL